MLNHLDIPILDSARDVKHRRQPIIKRNTRHLSYKVYNEESFRRLLEEQDDLQYKPAALFRNDEEVPDISEMGVGEALAFAKQRAKGKVARPTNRSLIEIGIGKGRRTREFELIWWPSLYSRSQYSKLTIRFFIRKISI